MLQNCPGSHCQQTVWADAPPSSALIRTSLQEQLPRISSVTSSHSRRLSQAQWGTLSKPLRLTERERLGLCPASSRDISWDHKRRMELLEEFKKIAPQYLADDDLRKIPGNESIIEAVVSWFIEQNKIVGATRDLILHKAIRKIPRTNPLRLVLLVLCCWGWAYEDARAKCVHFIRVFLRYHKFKNRERKI